MLLKLSLPPPFLSSSTCHTWGIVSLPSGSLFTSIVSHPILRSVVRVVQILHQKRSTLGELKVHTFSTQLSSTNVNHAWKKTVSMSSFYSLILNLFCKSLGTGLGGLGLMLHCLTSYTVGYPQSVLSVWVSATSQATRALPAPEEDPRWPVSEQTSHYT